MFSYSLMVFMTITHLMEFIFLAFFFVTNTATYFILNYYLFRHISLRLKIFNILIGEEFTLPKGSSFIIEYIFWIFTMKVCCNSYNLVSYSNNTSLTYLNTLPLCIFLFIVNNFPEILEILLMKAVYNLYKVTLLILIIIII